MDAPASPLPQPTFDPLVSPAARGPVHRKNPIPNRTRTTGINAAILPGHDSDAMSSPIRMVKNEARS
jgi:hypothetical protein